MIVEQIWVGNSLRNYNYLVACPETGEALAIDPTESAACLRMAKDKGWTIRHVLNTHEHHDHVSGNDAVCAATGATLIAHQTAQIPGVDRRVGAGDVIRVGRHELECLDTPGHTMSCLCVLAHGDESAIFTGDVLFNAGIGNCHGGDPGIAYETISTRLRTLPDDTRVYPGHDYLNRNLEFTLDREPDNQVARDLLKQYEAQDPTLLISTLGLEKSINTFLRLDSPAIIERLSASKDSLTEKEVFLALRRARDSW